MSSKLPLMFRFIILIILMFLGTDLYGQSHTIHFDVKRGGDKLGDITVTKRQYGDTTRIHVDSKVTFNVFFMDYVRHTEIRSAYVNGLMVSSHARISQNDDLKKLRKCRRIREGLYRCTKNNGKTKELRDAVPFNTTMLYFEEPSGFSEIFSETYLKMLRVKAIDDHTYKLKIPGEKVNKYYFRRGKLSKVKVVRSFFTITFERT